MAQVEVWGPEFNPQYYIKKFKIQRKELEEKYL
jgi:hypothetical protein